MSKKGLSNEEKRKRMQDFFLEKQDFFQLKDVEKLCSAEKGIVVQSIKDVLQSLVDDGLVESEKIGTSVYYWSLPSRALQKRNQKIGQLEAELAAETARNQEMTQRMEEFKQSQDNEETREELESEFDQLRKKRDELVRVLEHYKENDPQAYEDMKAGIKVSKQACNRWIENIFSLKSWLKNKFRIEESVIDRQFEIPSDLDYIS